MFKKIFHIALAVLTVFGAIGPAPLLSGVAHAASPNTLSYQGRLKDADGVVVADGSYDFSFTLWTALTAGTADWTEDQTLTVTDGYFSAQLGSVDPFLNGAGEETNFTVPLWLEVEVEAETLDPRVAVNSVAYSFSSRSIESFADEAAAEADAANFGGRMYYNTTSGNLFVYDSVAADWVDTTGAASSLDEAYNNFGASAAVVDVDNAQGQGDLTFTLDGADIAIVNSSAATFVTFSDAGTTTISGLLNVSGVSTFTANVNANAGFDVDDSFVIADGGAVTVGSSLTANGTVALGDGGDTIAFNSSDWDISATGDMTGIGAITADGAVTFTSTLAVTGDTTLTGDLAVNGDDLTSDGDLTIDPAGGQVLFADTDVFNIGGITGAAYNAISNAGGVANSVNVAADNDLYVQDDFEVDGTSVFDGNVDLNGTVTVNAVTTFNASPVFLSVITADAAIEANGGITTEDGQALTLNSGDIESINIGSDADAESINIGTGAATKTITIGNGTLATVLNVDTGTGGFDVDLLGAMSIDGELVVIGGAGDGNTATGDGDLYVVSDLETDGIVDFDGSFDFDGTTFDVDGSGLVSLTSTTASLTLATSDAGNIGDDSVVLSAGNVNPDAGEDGNDVALEAEDDVLIEATDDVDIDAADFVVLTSGTITLDTVGVLELNSSAGVISIGNDAIPQNINVGTGGSGRVITLGNTGGTTGVNIDVGTGGINFGDNAVSKTIDIGGVTANAADVISIATEGTSNDLISIGNSNASTTLALTGGDDWSMAATGVLTLSASAAQATALVITDTDYTNALSIGDNSVVGTSAAIDFSEFDVAAATGSVTINDDADLGSVSVEGTVLNQLSLAFFGAGAVTASGVLDLDATGALSLNSSGGAINVGNDAVAQAINVGTGAAARTITIGNATGATAVNVDAGSAGFSVDATGSIVLTSTNNAVDAINLTTNAGTSETIQLYAQQGTAVNSINIISDVGGIDLSSGLASGDAINLNAGNAAGGIDIDAGTAGINADSTGVMSFDGELFVIGGAADGDLATGDGDLYVVGDLEVDGSARYDGATSFFSDIDVTLAGTENVVVSNTTGDVPVDVLSLQITNTDTTAATQRGLVLTNVSNGAVSVTENLIALDNLDGDTLTDAILVAATGVITDGLDVSAANITNAVNVGDNTILGTSAAIDFTNFDVATTGNVTLATGVGLDSAGALVIGAGATTSTSLCNTATCDSVTIGSNADPDTITIGDAANDTTTLNGSTVAIDSADWDISAVGVVTGLNQLSLAFPAPLDGTNGITVTNTTSANSYDLFDIALTAPSADGAGDTARGINISMGATSEATDAVKGIVITGTAAANGSNFGIELSGGAGASPNEWGLVLNTGWDKDIYITDTSGVFAIADAGNLTFEDGSGNDFLVLSDVSTANNHVLTGDADTGLSLSGMTTDLSTPVAEDLTIAPGGVGDLIVSTDADTTLTLSGGGDGVDSLVMTDGDLKVSDGQVIIGFGGAGGDLDVTLDSGDGASITNGGNSTSTAALSVTNTATGADNVNGLSLTTTLQEYADDGVADTRQALNVSMTNNATDAGIDDTVYGINVLNLGGANQADGGEYAIRTGSSWDADFAMGNNETISNQVDDLITFAGVGATATNSTLSIDLDGSAAVPTLSGVGGTDIVAVNDSLSIGLDGLSTENGTYFSFAGGNDLYVEDDVGVNGDLFVDGIVSYGNEAALTLNSTTPSVSGGSHFFFNNNAGTLVSNFTNGQIGQLIFIRVVDGGGAFTDIDCTASSINCGTTDITTLASGDFLTFFLDGTNVWQLVSYMDDGDNHDAGSGFDLAEWFPASEELSAGDVVSVDPNGIETVRKSQGAYESSVVGIVSTQPGLTLGEPAVGYASQIALAGRVPVNVTNENGAIVPGDYLTTSSTPGVAMKATEAGPVIGIAMDSSDAASGQVVAKIASFWYVPPTSQASSLQGSDGSALAAGALAAETLVVAGDAVFEGSVTVQNHLYGGADIAGRARIVTGDTRVHVSFEEAYASQPIVTATLRTATDIPGYWWVEEESTTGFDIVLDGTLPYLVEFNWIALGVSGGQVSVSDGSTQNINVYVVNGTVPTESSVSTEETVEVVSEPSEADVVVDGTTDVVPDGAIPEEPVVTEQVPSEEPTLVEESVPTEEPVVTEEAPVDPAPVEEPVVTEEAPVDPAV